MASTNFNSRAYDAIRTSPFYSDKTKENDTYITNLTCPECGHREAYAWKQSPWAIVCNRKNNCGSICKTLDLFPEIKQDFELDFKPTPKRPHRPATEYLASRGLDASLNGLEYKYLPDIRGTGCGGVMFQIAGGVENGRIFTPPRGGGKTHNIGKTTGLFWRHPGINYRPTDPTFVVEGIINALSLIEMGYQAIAVLSAGTRPDTLDLSDFPKLILAFDNDKAGRKCARNWANALQKSGKHDVQAILPQRGDWNDILMRHGSGPDAKQFMKDCWQKMSDDARLALAETAVEYAETFFDTNGVPAGLFRHCGALYYSALKRNRPTCKRVGDFDLEVEYFEEDRESEEQSIFKYGIRITPRNGKPISFFANAEEMTSQQRMRTMLMKYAKVAWQGDKLPTTSLLELITHTKAPQIRQMQSIGYDKDSDCYVMPDYLIHPTGEKAVPNQRGIFRVGGKEYVRPAQHKAITPETEYSITSLKAVCQLIDESWGPRGITALGWTVASWFVNQIKAAEGFFPFLSLHGEPATGKSCLATVLNAMQGLHEEGIPMNKVNTSKGEVRRIGQRSGLFTGLLEANDTRQAGFDFGGTLRALYNDNPLQVRAKTTGGVATTEIPFYSAFMFVQNTEPFDGNPDKQRAISLDFAREDLSEETEQACAELMSIPKATLAACHAEILKHRPLFENKWQAEFTTALEEIKEAIPHERIAKNHALILTFVRLLAKATSLPLDVESYLYGIAKTKMADCTGREENSADEFFDVVDHLSKIEWESTRDEYRAIHAVDYDGRHLIVNITEVCALANRSGIPFRPNRKTLCQDLRRHPSFVKRDNIYQDGINGGRVRTRVWFFNNDIRLKEDE